MNIEPIGERVLITPIIQQSKTAGGIYIPRSAKEERNEGIVAAIGTGNNNTALPINIGDHIIYADCKIEEFTYSNQNYIMLNFKDVIAKITKKT